MPEKIAVLGGGVGAMSAAFALSSQAGWQAKYDITVYQMGWRLGGKGASGRNLEKNNRIEEHGLHIWMGMYENAFHLMQACYAELGRTPGHDPLATWDEAFKKHSFCTMMEEVNGQWVPWSFDVPTNDYVPGQGGRCLSIGNVIRQLLEWVFGTHSQPAFAGIGDQSLPLLVAVLKKAAALPEPISAISAMARAAFVAELDAYRTLRRFAVMSLAATWSDALRRYWILVDLAITLVRGLLADGVTSSFDPLDVYDFREWLTKHGATSMAVWSAPIRCIYELVFAYEKGDSSLPRLGAGVALRFLLRAIFAYQGAFIYFMQAGMGDVVFAPLYLVLKNRGVKFKFFHRVENLGLTDDQTSIATIRMSRQATMKSGDYNPLVNVNNLPCWPATPLVDQFIDGEKAMWQGYHSQGIEVFESAWSPWSCPEQITLQKTTDFDRIVLGISLAALKYVCPELVAASGTWKNMINNVAAVQTQAFQLWLSRSADDMGWTNVPEPAILDSYRDSWADFSHLIPRESWPAADQVRNIAYFCNAFPEAPSVPDPSMDPAFQVSENKRVHDISLNYLKTGLTIPLWANALNPSNSNELDWNALVDPTGAAGQSRFEYQFWRVNIDPTERYVQSLPNTTQFRLKADESGFANLVLAGDWLKTGINAGCVEAACMGGLQASRAISGYPAVVFGEEDFCPGLLTMAAAMAAPGTYVDHGGEQVLGQPVNLSGVDFYSFLIPSTLNAIQGLCDRYLNLPGQNQVRYFALMPEVLLTLASIARVQSLTNPYQQEGWAPEIDASFWVPLLAVDQTQWSLPRLVWFQPYLFVDNQWALAAGREIYGFVKEAATFPDPKTWAFQTAPAGAPGPVFTANTLAIKQFAPAAQAAPAILIDVRRKNPAVSGFSREFKNAGEIADDFTAGLTGGQPSLTQPLSGYKIDLAQTFLSPSVPIVLLKEFRDAANGKQACYQAVVETTATIDNLYSAGALAGPFLVKISDYDSHPMIAELGLPTGGVGGDLTLEVARAWYVQFDFEIGNGRVVWQA